MSSLELKIPPPVVALFFALCMWLASSLVAPLELPFVLRVGAALTLVAVGLVLFVRHAYPCTSTMITPVTITLTIPSGSSTFQPSRMSMS